MKEKHRAVNNKFNSMFPGNLHDKWLEMIRTWEKDKSKPNPFSHTEQGATVHSIRTS